MSTYFKPVFDILKFPVYLFAVILFIVSCNKDNNDPVPQSELLVSHSLIATYPMLTIKAVLSNQASINPEAQSIADRVKYGVKIYRVSYHTRYKDSVIVASGLVCMPESEGTFPVMSFQNGTNTAHNNAPSVNPSSTGYSVMEVMASNGYIVLIPDYIGFGTSSEILHPYYQKEATNNAVIDLIRTLREMDNLPGITAVSNDSLFLLGYSQGGEATISVTEELDFNDRIDYDLVAVSAGAGVYNLTDFTNYVIGIETFPSPMYFPYYIYSQIKYGEINSPLGRFFKEPYASNIPELFDGTKSNNDINNALTNQISDLLTANLIQNFATGAEFSDIRESLLSNSIEGWNTSLKIRLYHGTVDDNVPPSQSLNLYDEFISAGSNPANVQLLPMEGLDHGTGLFPWGISSIVWFNSLRN